MRSTWHALLDAADRGETVALCTVVRVEGSAPRHGGARMVVWPDERFVGSIGGGALEHHVLAEARAALREGAPRLVSLHLTRDLGMCCGGATEVYVEPVSPVERLVIYGAGHVAKPTADMAAQLGFEVTVVDDRDDWNTPERFPRATRVVADPRAHARALATGAHTWVLVTTHAHALDQDLVELLLPRPLAWIGLIGSRTKATRFFLRLRAAGMDETLFARLRVPVGLDLGAETPEEIAVSIVGELVQVRRGGTAATMADRKARASWSSRPRVAELRDREAEICEPPFHVGRTSPGSAARTGNDETTQPTGTEPT